MADIIPMNLFNTCNKLWLLSSNIIGADKAATITHLVKDYNVNRIGKRLEADKCIKFDAMSVGVVVEANKDTTIKKIIEANNKEFIVSFLQNKIKIRK